MITAEIIKELCPRLHPTRVQAISDLLNDICPKYGINSANIMHEFLANLCEECAEFSQFEEGLHYTKPARLMQVWPKRFPNYESTLPYVNNEKALAMHVYGKRQDLGNISKEDGFIFRGSGPIQMTGRAIVTRFANYMAATFKIRKPPEEWAELLRTSDEYGIHSACWFFAIAKKLIDEAESDNMKEIVKRINGGYTNYSSRLKYYELCKKLIK